MREVGEAWDTRAWAGLHSNPVPKAGGCRRRHLLPTSAPSPLTIHRGKMLSTACTCTQWHACGQGTTCRFNNHCTRHTQAKFNVMAPLHMNTGKV